LSATDASDAILLERKDDMKRRGLASPDDGDALALTFAYPVANATGPRSGGSRRGSRGCGGGSCDSSPEATDLNDGAIIMIVCRTRAEAVAAVARFAREGYQSTKMTDRSGSIVRL
jgi:hypothetical protein